MRTRPARASVKSCPRAASASGSSYEYDFGDSWWHDILFEGCLRAERGRRYPVCLEANGPAHRKMWAAPGDTRKPSPIPGARRAEVSARDVPHDKAHARICLLTSHS